MEQILNPTNTIVLDGTLTEDAETRNTKGGKPYAILNLRNVRQSRNGYHDIMQIKVMVYGWLANKAIGKKKGAYCQVVGTLAAYNTDNDDGTTDYGHCIKAIDIQIAEVEGDDAPFPDEEEEKPVRKTIHPETKADEAVNAELGLLEGIDDDDLPF